MGGFFWRFLLARLEPVQDLMSAAAWAVRRVVASALRRPVLSNSCSSIARASHPQAAILGIDPDARGAVALLQTDGRVELFDSPWLTVKVGKTNRRRLDAPAIAALLRGRVSNTAKAYVETATPNFRNGKQGWYGSGYGYGLWTGVLAGLDIEVVPVTAARWKRDLELIGKGKDRSRAMAMELYPDLESSFQAVKDHGRAESMLIALGRIARPKFR